MQTLPRNVNPFALMLDPQSVIAQIERSERLEGLHRRVCRPLDKPLLGGAIDQTGESSEVSATDTDDQGTADEAALAVQGEDQRTDQCTDERTDQRFDGVSGGLTRHD